MVNIKKPDKLFMGLMDMLNMDNIVESATLMADQMLSSTLSLVDKLMSSVMLT
jgi:hypothetical protein